jgi:tetratricopeptide (TPR) repeat protein
LEASDAELAAALALARQGRKADALRQLEWLGLRLDANAHYHYELAVLYAGRDKLPQAMAQAARAAEIDPRYGADAALLALADRALAVRAAADAARRFFGLTLDARSAEILVRSALENGRPGAVLREIRGLLQARDLLAGLPERLRLPFEAAAERTCAARKEALRAIAARPDPRMEPFLRRFRADGGCGILGLEDCYSCERAEIRAVFAALDAARAAGGTKSDGGP